MARKHNYLNNKDLLIEIHKSKNTYCVFRDKQEDNEFDIILDDVSEIPANIQQAKENRAKRLAKSAYDQAIKDGLKVKQAEFAIDPASYSDDDVVFRVNTFEHIPLAPPKPAKKTAKRKKVVDTSVVLEDDSEDEVETKANQKYVKVNFPPFYHYRYINGVLHQVAKSHWKGKYDNGAFTGEFSTKHGTMTEKLALMYMKLCERYATKANWRGYTYNDEMRGQGLLQLSMIGLQFNEAKSQNPFAYYTAVVNNAFTRVLNIEKRNQAIRDNILEANDLTPSYTRQNENEMAMMKEREEAAKA